MLKFHIFFASKLRKKMRGSMPKVAPFFTSTRVLWTHPPLTLQFFKCLGGPNPKPNCIRRSSRSPSNFWSLGMASSHIAGGAKYSIFQFKFKICSFPFSPFTMPYFLGPYLHIESFHQIYCFISCIAEKVCHVKLSTRLILGLPTRVCTNWSGQVGFGPHISLEPICSNFINSSNYWLAQNSSTHHSENLFRIC